jgi:energy-coupling factor transporter ATP-binding protein EcfA2
MSLYGDRSAFCVRSVWDTSGWGSRPPNCPEEAQRVKLATELQRAQRGGALYVLDEPTTGLHPSDVDKLMTQLGGLVEAGNSVVVVEHDMSVAAASDWIIDIGPGRRRGRHDSRVGHPQRGCGRFREPHGAISRGMSRRVTDRS